MGQDIAKKKWMQVGIRDDSDLMKVLKTGEVDWYSIMCLMLVYERRRITRPTSEGLKLPATVTTVHHNITSIQVT